MADIHWIPLESNPEVLNKYAHGLGLPDEWNFMDVFSLDDEVLAMLPKPVVGLLAIYPITENTGTFNIGKPLPPDSGAYFMKQTVGNACGTVALLHTIGNKRQQLNLQSGSTFDKFFNKSADTACSPEERAKLMETDEVQRRLRLLSKLIWSGSAGRDSSLNTAHEAAASEGQTEAPSRDCVTNLHFISLVEFNGQLLELDGRLDGPVTHGPTTPETFLSDSAGVIREFMKRESQNLNFSIVALAKGQPLF